MRREGRRVQSQTLAGEGEQLCHRPASTHWQAVPAAHTTVVVAMCIVIVKMACEKFPLCAEFMCVCVEICVPAV